MFRLDRQTLANGTNNLLLVSMRSDNENKFGIFTGKTGSLLSDVQRGFLLNDQKFQDELIQATDKEAKLTQILSENFPNNGERLRNKHHQGYQGVMNVLQASLVRDDVSFLLQPDSNLTQHTPGYEEKNDVFYFRDRYSNIAIKLPNVDEPVPLRISLEVFFTETENGFELMYIETNEPWVRNLLLGEPYYGELLTSLKKNAVDFNPYTAEGPVVPLSYRLRESFHEIFGSKDPAQSDFDSFMGFPSENNTAPLAFTVVGYIFFPIKNLVKLATEYLPAVIKNTAQWGIDTLKKNYSQRPWAIAAIGALTGVAYAAKGLQLFGRTITSPIKSFQEGWKVHPALGILSAVVTVAAYGAIGFFASPILIGVAAKIGLSTLTTGLLTAASYIPPIAGLSPAALLVGAATAAAAAIVFPIRGLANIIANKMKRAPKPKLIEEKVEAGVAPRSVSGSRRQMRSLIGSNAPRKSSVPQPSAPEVITSPVSPSPNATQAPSATSSNASEVAGKSPGKRPRGGTN